VSLYQCSFHLSFRKFVSLSVCQAVLFSFFLSLASFTHAESVTTANLSNHDFYYVLVDSSDNNTVYALMGYTTGSTWYTNGDGSKFFRHSMYLARIDRNQINKLYLGDYYLSSYFNTTASTQDKYSSTWHGVVAKSGSSTVISVFFSSKDGDGGYGMLGTLFTIYAPTGVNSLTKASEKTLFSNSNWGWFPKILSGEVVEHFSYAGYYRYQDTTRGSYDQHGTTMLKEYRDSLATDSQSIMPEISNADIAAKIVAKATGVSFSSGRINGISTRASVGKTAEKYMMAGVYIRGTAQKKALVRATGKGLVKQGVNTSLDAKLEVYELATSTTAPADRNDNWKDHPSYSTVQNAGGMSDDYDAALVSGLNQGYYSMVVMPSGGSMTSGGGGTEGIGLVEVYDNDPASASRLSGISTRSYVGSAATDYMYAGCMRDLQFKAVV